MVAPPGAADGPSSGERARVAFFAAGDPHDPDLWSGTPYQALMALRDVCDVIYVERRPYPRWWQRFARIVLRASGGRVDPRLIGPLNRLASLPARRRLVASGADCYVSFAASGMAADLPAELRQIVCSDATSKAIIGYYDQFSRLLEPLRDRFIAHETQAMRKAAVLAYPSRWALESAIRDFSGMGEKAVLIPWGANLAPLAHAVPKTVPQGRLKLLFAGMDWARKGGLVAVETARLLQGRGIDCQLDIVGVGPDVPGVSLPDNVRVHGKLSRKVPAEADLLERFFAEAHLFLLPTRAEALGMVFAESASRGLPSIAYATGGVSTIVQDGKTGVLLDPDAGPADFARAIADLVAAPERYAEMSAAALADSRDRLDWSVWAERMRPLLK